MRRDLERRLRHLEIVERTGSIAIEYWIFESDGMVTGPRGERMTAVAFEAMSDEETGPANGRAHWDLGSGNIEP